MAPGGAKLFLKYSVAGRTVRRALKVALVVGPVLTLINHAPSIIALDLDPRFAFQTVLTFFVPYLVSTYASAMTELSQAASEPGAEDEAPR